VTNARSDNPYGTPIAEGKWPYAGLVPTKVRILQSDIAFGTGDYEEEPEEAEDRPGLCFYIEWEPAGGGSGGSHVGPFSTVEEAKLHAEKSAAGILWILP
jgi:hypothetical protein